MCNAFIMLTGRLTKDPEISQTKSGKKVLNASVAVSTSEKDAEGKYQSDFYDIEWYGVDAFMDSFMLRAAKGTIVQVMGELVRVSYFSKQKNAQVDKYKVKVTMMDGVKALGALKTDTTAKPATKPAAKPAPVEDDEPADANDLPF